jgi:enoyl-[acyl-carrier protein] reductase I
MLLKNKKGLIVGIANTSSIAYSIAKIFNEHGATLALTYQGEATKKRVLPIAEELDNSTTFECDVLNEESMNNLFDALQEQWGELDFVVHSVGFSDRHELQGRFLDTSLPNFLSTMHVSCYSLLSLVQRAEKLMKNGGSILTLSYYGAIKVVPNYNVMGVAKAALESSVRYLGNDLGIKNIRVNAISAGPIKTLAASGISGIRTMLKVHEATAPLKRNTEQVDVAKSALYLISDLASGVTGEIHYVDCGYNTVGSANTAAEYS